MESLLLNFSEAHWIVIYFIIFAGMFIEGEVVLIMAGILVRSGKIDFLDALAVAFLGVIAHDVAYWLLGKKFSDSRRKKFWFINLEKLDPFINRMRRNHNLYIFVSKFAWTMNRLFLISSGYLKMPLKRVMRYSVPAAFIWSTTFISLGYIFAHKTDILKKDIRTIAILFSAFIIVIFLFEKLFQKNLDFKDKN